VAGADWENIATELLHPTQLYIIKRAVADPEARFSPKQLQAESGEPLGNVAYHVRALYEKGLLRTAGTRPRRGAVEHFYRAGAKLLE
jgi:hypothetical protein